MHGCCVQCIHNICMLFLSLSLSLCVIAKRMCNAFVVFVTHSIFTDSARSVSLPLISLLLIRCGSCTFVCHVLCARIAQYDIHMYTFMESFECVKTAKETRQIKKIEDFVCTTNRRRTKKINNNNTNESVQFVHTIS